MRIFDFLYYCLYRIFNSIKRAEFKDEKLTCILYSILLSTNTIILFSTLKFVIPKGMFNNFYMNVLLKLLLIIVFLVFYLFCNNYFIVKNNWIRIITSYDDKYFSRVNYIIWIGIIYPIFTFGSFIGIAILFSRIKWHL